MDLSFADCDKMCGTKAKSSLWPAAAGLLWCCARSKRAAVLSETVTSQATWTMPF